MRANAILFWILGGLLRAVGGRLRRVDRRSTSQRPEHGVGRHRRASRSPRVLAAFIAFYLGRVHTAQGAELPEDRLDANIDDGDPELGYFSPWSWWPFVLAAGAALAFLGLAIGFWISFIAVPIVADRARRLELRVLPRQLRPLMTIREARPATRSGLFALVEQLGHAFRALDRASLRPHRRRSYFAGAQPVRRLLVVDDGDEGCGGYALTDDRAAAVHQRPSASCRRSSWRDARVTTRHAASVQAG